jgi:hypothetical protein
VSLKTRQRPMTLTATNLQHFGTMLVPRIEAILDSYGW